jgi:transcriptional regulator with XRE-family HTH domain
MPDEPQDNTRTVKPDGDKVRQLRKAKGWRVEDLAEKADCTSRTVTSVEKGTAAFMYTITNIAKALGVEYQELLQQNKHSDTAAPTGRASAVVSLAIDYDQFDETVHLVALVEGLSTLLGQPRIKILKIERGSTNITLELDENALSPLFKAFADGQLRQYNVQWIRNTAIKLTALSDNQELQCCADIHNAIEAMGQALLNLQRDMTSREADEDITSFTLAMRNARLNWLPVWILSQARIAHRSVDRHKRQEIVEAINAECRALDVSFVMPGDKYARNACRLVFVPDSATGAFAIEDEKTKKRSTITSDFLSIGSLPWQDDSNSVHHPDDTPLG